VVHVIESNKVNAFVLPGGQIFVYTGLVDFIGKEDDGLAMVLGHEMSHAILRHGAEQASLKTIFYGLETAVLGAIWFLVPYDTLAWVLHQAESKLFNAITELPWSRKLESEADDAGLQIASWACYNPEAAPMVWEMMDNYAKAMGKDNSAMRYFSTHPTHETRIDDLNEQVGGAWEEVEWRCSSHNFLKDVRLAMEAAQKQRMNGLMKHHNEQIKELEAKLQDRLKRKRKAEQQNDQEKAEVHEQKVQIYKRRLKQMKENPPKVV